MKMFYKYLIECHHSIKTICHINDSPLDVNYQINVAISYLNIPIHSPFVYHITSNKYVQG